MKRNILVSMIIIGVVGAGISGTTMALFNDTETSDNNKFTAGELDLKIDWEESYNGEQIETQELTNNPAPIFNISDIKPGDWGEATVSLHLDDNPGWIWMNLNQTANKEGICTEPEAKAESQGYQQPILHLPMDDSTKDVAMGNDATLHGTSAYSTGKKDKSVSFNGDAYGTVKHKPSYELSEGTISLWIRTNKNGLNGHKGIIGKDAKGFENGGHIYLSLRNGEPNFRLQDAGNTYEIQSNTQLTEGKWHHITASFGSQGQKLYVDGNEVASSNYAGGISNNTNPFVFGASPWASKPGQATPVQKHFIGDIDEIKLYKEQIDSNSEQTACGNTGELGEHLQFKVWSDDGDNIHQEDENVIFNGTAHELAELNKTEKGILLDGNPSTNQTEAFPGAQTKYIGIKWQVPLDTGNEIQGDSKKFEFSFYTEQKRHNPQTPEKPEEPEPPQNGSDNETTENMKAISFVSFCTKAQATNQNGQTPSNPCTGNTTQLVKFEWTGNSFQPEGGDPMGISINATKFKDNDPTEPIKAQWTSNNTNIETTTIKSGQKICSQPGGTQGTTQSCTN
jgi:predicted ribosomally synthesized peptide with SipW-like signal peptide